MKLLTSLAAALLSILVTTYLKKDAMQQQQEPYHPHPEISLADDPDAIAGRLAAALAIPTVGSSPAPNHIGDPAPFQRFHAFLRASFPTVFKALTVEKVNGYSLLFTWQGSDPSLKPVILSSHMDVVPAPPSNWTHPPFAGTIADGWIWGRGAVDSKCTLTATLEAVTKLLRSGMAPRRTVLLAFGHDEELGGTQGGRKIAELLESRGLEAELLLDEGGVVALDGIVSGGRQLVPGPVALVGTAEKGSLDLVIKIKGIGGHASMPPTEKSGSVAGRLGRLLSKLDAQQTATKLGPPATDFLKAVGGAAPWALLRGVLSLAENPAVNPIMGQLLGQYGGKDVAAMVRTTVAVVGVAAGGTAANVLPQEAEVRLNVRTLPGEDAAVVREYLQTLIGKKALDSGDFTIESVSTGFAASEVTPARGPAWDLVCRTIQETLTPKAEKKGGDAGQITVIPYLVPAMTDSRWYSKIARQRVFRFSPVTLCRGCGDIDMFHGVDERISVKNYVDAVSFFARFIKLTAGEDE